MIKGFWPIGGRKANLIVILKEMDRQSVGHTGEID
jgi:hypothetical protein